MSDTIRIITYGDINASATDSKDGSKIPGAGGTPVPRFDDTEIPSETTSESALQTGAKGIGEFEVNVDTLEAEMGHLIDVVQRLLVRAEQKSQSEIALDEIELSVEINGEGKISILGTGAQAGGKGAIKLKFKRLILMPKYASVADIAILKNDATRAERRGELQEAKSLWRSVLNAAQGVDEDAIEALNHIAIQENRGNFVQSSASPKSDNSENQSPKAVDQPQEPLPEVELKSDVGYDYTKLKKLLSEGRWKKADKETARCMLQVAGREEEGWLRAEDIEKFPCTDLRTIDQLWVKYSNGKFGFSVQKKIYQSLGGTREYNKKVYEAFGNKVGWRQGGKWLDYSELTFSLDTDYMGHLPYKWALGSRKILIWWSPDDEEEQQAGLMPLPGLSVKPLEPLTPLCSVYDLPFLDDQEDKEESEDKSQEEEHCYKLIAEREESQDRTQEADLLQAVEDLWNQTNKEEFMVVPRIINDEDKSQEEVLEDLWDKADEEEFSVVAPMINNDVIGMDEYEEDEVEPRWYPEPSERWLAEHRRVFLWRRNF